MLAVLSEKFKILTYTDKIDIEVFLLHRPKQVAVTPRDPKYRATGQVSTGSASEIFRLFASSLGATKPLAGLSLLVHAAQHHFSRLPARRM